MSRLLFLLLVCFSTSLFGQCEDAGPDLQPLLDLYRSANGSNWINRSGWELGDLGLDCNYCNWANVQCNEDQRVIRLLLNDNRLQGELPPTFGELDALVSLGLKRANIGASIVELERLTSLTGLNLYQVNYSGPFPTELLSFSQIRELDISYNAFSGEIPDFSVFPFLRRLYLDANNFSGPPPSLIGMDRLLEISMQWNEFTGRIPESWNSENLPELEILDARFGLLYGPVPTSLATLAGATINLGNNLLSGCYSDGLAPFCGNNPPYLVGNAGLPRNGADWFFNGQFCEDGESCGPCPEELIITHDSILLNLRALYPNCVDLAGDLRISGNGITDLRGTETIETIGGNLIIEDTDIADLEGMNSLVSVDGDWIVRNASLASLRPLKSIRIVGGSLELNNLPNLSSNGLSGQFSVLVEVGEDFKAINLPQLTSLQSFGNINKVPGTLRLSDLDAMTTFDGPGYLNIAEVNLFEIYDNDRLEHVDYFRDLAFRHISNLIIRGNPELRNLNGFDEAGTIDRVAIANNPKLTVCAVPPICLAFEPGETGTRFFTNNGYGCESAAQVQLDCEGNLPLPVELLSFSAAEMGKVNQLEWTSLQETDFDRYVVERSTDEGLAWREMTSVLGAGAGAAGRTEEQGEAGQRYVATDEAPLRYTLYRLRMVDLDGSFSFSPVVAVTREKELTLRVYPNPSEGSFVVSIPAVATRTSFSLQNAAGREVWRTDLVSTEILRVPTTDFPAGLYFVRLRAGHRTWTKRVILQ